MTPLRPGRAEVRRDLLALGFGAAVLFFVSLGARDLWQPNEPTYGQAVVEMSKRGDWIVPTVNGREFAEKPVLYYWMALAAAGALGGVDEFVLRLPAAAAGVLRSGSRRPLVPGPSPGPCPRCLRGGSRNASHPACEVLLPVR